MYGGLKQTYHALCLMLWPLLLVASPGLRALELNDFAVHGFLSQGAIYTTDNNFFGHSDDGVSLDFTEIGLNGRYRLTSDVSFAGQLLLRRAGADPEDDLNVDHAFVDYNLLATGAHRVYTSAGRVKLPYGLFNETRDVAFTRPGILMPQPVYFDRTRRLAVSGDGLMLRSEHDLESGTVFFNVVGFRPNVDTELRRAIAIPVSGGPNAENSYIGRLMYESGDGRFRTAITHAGLRLGYDAGQGDVLEGGNLSLIFNVLSAQYNAESWSITSEFTTRRIAFLDFGRFLPDVVFRGEGIYIQGDYRFSNKLSGFVRAEALYPDRGDKSGNKLVARGQFARQGYQEDYVLGMRWDLTPSWMFRAEFHNIRGVAALPASDNPNPAETDDRWNLVALQLSFRF